ncbi:hypothetical protein KBY91_15455 [Streptomyces sp. RK23]|uniref:hypothetical protein n=1 Tax=unclassified Streptomyces TaxID=2593676 RepID=UPI001B36414F|nr:MULTISPECIES: hypothetical protein [unclassified Streptomyces]MBQ0969225.1 hypothetical protein [Streptomyces sp. RK74B]MBQ1004806.1 hypothetical protein [Streptomyces sp. RK23]
MATLDDILISVGIRDNTGGPSQRIQQRMDAIRESSNNLGRSLSKLLTTLPAMAPAFAGASVAAGALASTVGGAVVATGALYAAMKPQIGLVQENAEAAQKLADAQETAARKKALADKLSAEGSDLAGKAQKAAASAALAAADAQAAYERQTAGIPKSTADSALALAKLKTTYEEWSTSLAGDTMPIFTSGLNTLRTIIPKLTPLVKGAASIFRELMQQVEKKVQTKAFDDFMKRLTDWSLGGLRKTIDGIGAIYDKIAAFVLSDGFQQFLDMGGESGQNIADILQKLGQFMAEFIEAAGPLAGLSFYVLQVLADALNAIPRDLLEILAPTILSIAIAMRLWNAALAIYAAYQTLANIAANGFPAVWIMAAIVGLIALIVTLWKKNETFRRIVTQAWNAVKSAVLSVVNWFRDKAWPWMKGVWDNIANGARSAVEGVKETFNDVVDWFGGLPGRIAAAGRGMWDSVQDGLKQALNGAIYVINQGIWFINDKLIGNANRIPGVDIPFIPYIPYLAKGGITTGPTMAMIGEGREQEAVLPLSKLQHLLDVNAATALATARTPRVEPAQTRLLFELRGGSRAFREFFQESVRSTAGGDVVKFAEG